MLLFLIGSPFGRNVGFQPDAKLVAKAQLLGGKVQVHGFSSIAILIEFGRLKAEL